MSQEHSWMSVDLGVGRSLIANYYCLRHGWINGSIRLQSWYLLGSNDGSKWFILKEHKDDNSLPDKEQSEAAWEIEGVSQAYRHFRIRMTGKNSSGQYTLCCAGIELWGRLLVNVPPGEEIKVKCNAGSPLPVSPPHTPSHSLSLSCTLSYTLSHALSRIHSSHTLLSYTLSYASVPKVTSCSSSRRSMVAITAIYADGGGLRWALFCMVVGLVTLMHARLVRQRRQTASSRRRQRWGAKTGLVAEMPGTLMTPTTTTCPARERPARKKAPAK
jgi:hypothetical protein